MTLLMPILALAHVPPSPAEFAHLHTLQRDHARKAKAIMTGSGTGSTHARKLSSPDYTCSDGAKSVAEPWKVSGTSLGGWLVLEPWLTPSLFYQFLGSDLRYGPDINKIREKTGMDQKSFCTALGPKEANRQLRRHWKLWLTEQHIADIAQSGATHVRIPVGDWMWEPYDIYDKVEGGVRCNDGAIEELDRALKLCEKYGMKALLDMHAWVGSQNGLDNSGETKFVRWAEKFDSGTSGEMYAPKGTFDHWAFKGWDWIINSTADWGMAMQLINEQHWAHSIRVLTKVVAQYGKHPAIWGLSPVNEVGAWTPMDVLRKFYWEAYALVRKAAPHWIYVMDSSFRGSEVGRDDFMKGCPNKALDKHPYHAWAPWGDVDTYYKRSCSWGPENKAIEDEVDFPVIAGECPPRSRPRAGCCWMLLLLAGVGGGWWWWRLLLWLRLLLPAACCLLKQLCRCCSRALALPAVLARSCLRCYTPLFTPLHTSPHTCKASGPSPWTRAPCGCSASTTCSQASREPSATWSRARVRAVTPTPWTRVTSRLRKVRRTTPACRSTPP